MKLGLIGRAPHSYDDAFMATMAGAYLEQTAWTQLRLGAVRDLVDPHAGERVLDLGSAGGAVTHFLSTFGCEAIGVDSEQRAIDLSRELFPALRFELADVAALPFPDDSFDKAVAADLVEHLEDADYSCMLAEAARVLVPGGTLSIYTPNPRHPIERLKKRDVVLARNETHIGLRDGPTLAGSFRDAGFTVEVSEWRSSYFPGLRAVERLGASRTEALRYRLCLRGRLPASRRSK